MAESIPDLCQVCMMDTVWWQKTGLSGALSYQSCYEQIKSVVYHHNITINSTVKHHRAYTHLTHEDDHCATGSITFEPENSENDLCTYQAYLTNASSPLPSHTSKVFLPKSIWTELSDKVRKLIMPTTRILVAKAYVLQLPQGLLLT